MQGRTLNPNPSPNPNPTPSRNPNPNLNPNSSRNPNSFRNANPNPSPNPNHFRGPNPNPNPSPNPSPNPNPNPRSPWHYGSIPPSSLTPRLPLVVQPDSELEMLTRNSLNMGSIFGIPIRAHHTLILYALCVIAYYGLTSSRLNLALAMVVYGPVLFGTVLIHELGHAITARILGGQAHVILLWPLGGLAICGLEGTRLDRLKTTLMGPATHIPMLGFWFACMYVSLGSVTVSTAGLTLEQNFFGIVCVEAAVMNISLCVFNLLCPAYPLDCSQILISAMMMRDVPPDTAYLVIMTTSIPIVIALMCYGLLGVVRGDPGSSLCVFLSLWMGHQARRLKGLRDAGQLSLHPLFRNYA